MQSFDDEAKESFLYLDSDGFWKQYRLGYLQLLEIHNPPLEPWKLDIAAIASIACECGPQIRRFGFEDIFRGTVAVDLPTFVDMSSNDPLMRLEMGHPEVNLDDVFMRMTEERRVDLHNGEDDCIGLHFDVDIGGDKAAVWMNLIKDRSLI